MKYDKDDGETDSVENETLRGENRVKTNEDMKPIVNAAGQDLRQKLNSIENELNMTQDFS